MNWLSQEPAYVNRLSQYIPQDRCLALAQGATLPDQTHGAALLADISGFTPLTEILTEQLGPRRGIETLTQQINTVYDALITEVERYGGSVISFAGDAVVCWFAERERVADAPYLASLHAAAAALAMQSAMGRFPELALKITIASGAVRRLVVGDPTIQLIDVLAGATLERLAQAELLTAQGEILADEMTVANETIRISEWRQTRAGDRFADVIGLSELPASQPGGDLPQPSLNSLRPWILPTIFEREQGGHGAFLTELRPVTAVFLQFSGIDYTAPDAGEKLDRFIREAQIILSRYEGALLQLVTGDKGSYLYAVFGAPVAHEDDTRRAVKAALSIRSTADHLDFLTPVQIGISQGTVRAGAYGGQSRRTYGVLGDDVNLAARLMSQAKPGEILASGRVQTAVANSFSFEPRPPLTLKGKAEPLPVFVVTGVQERRAIRLQEPIYTLPMIGREKEMALIEQKMSLALQGRGQALGIIAEAGLGKSRLVAELIRLARRLGFTGYGGSCQADSVNRSYFVWKAIWGAFFDIDPVMPTRKILRLIEGDVAELAPQRLSSLPLLGQVLDLPQPVADNEFTQTLEPQFRKAALHALLVDCLKAAAREEPLLLVVEDAHWIDALSHDLLEEIARIAAGLPLLLVVAYRPPQLQRLQTPRIETLPHFSKIELSELSSGEAEQVIRAKMAQHYPARGAVIPSGLVDQLMTRAQGNPFYLEELLNYLRDRGIDAADPAALDQLELPDSLHTLILSRIDQLAEQEKNVLRAASIIGRLFYAAWLTGYYPGLGESPQVQQDLTALADLDITSLEMPEPELTYLFKHIVTHEVTYESLPYATRAKLHEQLARYIEETHTAAPPVDMLAFHYSCSGNVAKQREYLQKAAEAAQSAFANVAALDYYERLLPLLTEREEQIILYRRRGTLLELMGLWAEAEDEYQRALKLSEDDESGNAANNQIEMARCQLALGKLHRLRGDYPLAIHWLEKARASFAAAKEQSGLGQALIEIGTVFWRQGEFAAAREHLEAGLDLARITGDQQGVAQALNDLGNVAWFQGDYPEALAFHEESLAIRTGLGDKRGVTASLNNLGLVTRAQGDDDAARRLHEKSLALRREMGDKWGEASSLNNLANITHDLGDFSQTRALHEESLALRREMGDKWGMATSIGNLGGVALAQGDYLLARSLLEESLALREEMDDKGGVASSLNNLGKVAWQLGDFAAAQSCYERALAIAQTIGDRRETSLLWCNLGALHYAQGEIAQAYHYSQQAVNLAQEIDARDILDYILAHSGHTLLARHEPDLARNVYQQAYALYMDAGKRHLAMEPLAGLARVALAQGEIATAVAHVEEILAYLAVRPLEGALYPFLVHLTAVQALQAAVDERAAQTLAAAYAQLQAQAAKLPASDMKDVYLTIPAHQEISKLATLSWSPKGGG